MSSHIICVHVEIRKIICIFIQKSALSGTMRIQLLLSHRLQMDHDMEKKASSGHVATV